MRYDIIYTRIILEIVVPGDTDPTTNVFEKDAPLLTFSTVTRLYIISLKFPS